MFASSIMEVLGPMGCPVRLNWSAVELSTSVLEATLVSAQEVHPEDGACRKDYSKYSHRLSSSPHRIGRPLGPVSRGSAAGRSLERCGTRLKDAPVSNK